MGMGADNGVGHRREMDDGSIDEREERVTGCACALAERPRLFRVVSCSLRSLSRFVDQFQEHLFFFQFATDVSCTPFLPTDRDSFNKVQDIISLSFKKKKEY
jgi:hypothetical protein